MRNNVGLFIKEHSLGQRAGKRRNIGENRRERVESHKESKTALESMY